MNKLGWLLIAGAGLLLIGCDCCSKTETADKTATMIILPQACENDETKQVTDSAPALTGITAERGKEDFDTKK